MRPPSLSSGQPAVLKEFVGAASTTRSRSAARCDGTSARRGGRGRSSGARSATTMAPGARSRACPLTRRCPCGAATVRRPTITAATRTPTMRRTAATVRRSRHRHPRGTVSPRRRPGVAGIPPTRRRRRTRGQLSGVPECPVPRANNSPRARQLRRPPPCRYAAPPARYRDERPHRAERLDSPARRSPPPRDAPECKVVGHPPSTYAWDDDDDDDALAGHRHLADTDAKRPGDASYDAHAIFADAATAAYFPTLPPSNVAAPPQNLAAPGGDSPPPAENPL